MNDESSPEGAHESATTALMVAQPTDSPQAARRDESALTFEDREAARAAGYEAGINHKFGIEVEHRARALLDSWATESRNMATEYAAKVGPAWSALIAECSQVDD